LRVPEYQWANIRLGKPGKIVSSEAGSPSMRLA
jgi:hypothetical protein